MESKFRQTDEEEKLGQLLRSLDRVEAPTGFATRVKARIASEKSDGSRRGLGWLVRLGAPAAGLIVLAALIWIAGGSGSGALSLAVAEPEPFIRPVAVDPIPETVVPADSVAEVERPAPRDRSANGGARDSRTERDERGSVDFAVRPGAAKTPRTDPSLTSKTPELQPTSAIPIRSVLSDLGIDAVAGNGKWNVDAVRANSLADRSGIVPGDTIEAIDDRPVGVDTVFLKAVQGKTITVLRNGRNVLITLK